MKYVVNFTQFKRFLATIPVMPNRNAVRGWVNNGREKSRGRRRNTCITFQLTSGNHFEGVACCGTDLFLPPHEWNLARYDGFGMTTSSPVSLVLFPPQEWNLTFFPTTFSFSFRLYTGSPSTSSVASSCCNCSRHLHCIRLRSASSRTGSLI